MILRARHNAKYLLTTRCNQDVVENLFSRIRYTGSAPSHHVGPVDFMYRLRLVLLGKSTKYVVDAASVTCTEDKDDTPVMLSEALLEGLPKMERMASTTEIELKLDSEDNEEDGEPILETILEVDTGTRRAAQKRALNMYVAFWLTSCVPSILNFAAVRATKQSVRGLMLCPLEG